MRSSSTSSLIPTTFDTCFQRSYASEAPDLRRRTDGERQAAPALSFAQERLWYLDQMEPGLSVYNLGGALRLAGRLEAPALEAALCEVVRRHEALRTSFALAGDRPAQVVAPPPLSLRLPLADLTALGPAANRPPHIWLAGFPA